MRRIRSIFAVAAMTAAMAAFAAPAMAQDQSFDGFDGGGDNANQTVNVSGNANTGNVQDQFGFTQIGSEIDEFEIDGGGSSIEVGGDSDVSSSQEVNQAASSG